MPASLPGSTLAQNIANPSLGAFVIYDLLSGPARSTTLDRDDTVLSWDANNHPVYTAGTITKATTGQLATGIGFGQVGPIGLTAPQSIKDAGFTDDYKPGVSTPVPADSANSTLMYLGGGRSNADGTPNPYTAGFGIGGAGAGGSRDAGAGPFTGFGLKMVTAAGAVATGAAVETGFANRSGVALTTGQSVFGSATAASATVA